jgi:hypothetical protein
VADDASAKLVILASTGGILNLYALRYVKLIAMFLALFSCFAGIHAALILAGESIINVLMCT